MSRSHDDDLLLEIAITNLVMAGQEAMDCLNSYARACARGKDQPGAAAAAQARQARRRWAIASEALADALDRVSQEGPPWTQH